MKKFALFLLVVCCYSTQLAAQFNILDDIDLGPTSDILNNLSSSNWGPTHGTPDYVPTYLSMWSAKSNDFGQKGEGAYRIVNFTGQKSYDVRMALTFVNSHGGPEYFDVVLANDPLPTLCAITGGCPIPSFSGSRLLYTYSGYSFNDKILRLQFSTASGESYKYLIIYPRAEISSGATITMQIECLGVLSNCAGPDLLICSGAIPSGTLIRNSFSIGSNQCQGTPVTSSLSSNTKLQAIKNINLTPKTTIAVNSGTTFIMETVNCSQVVDNVPLEQVAASLDDGISPCAIPKPINGNFVSISDDNFDVYPNPTSGKFKAKFGLSNYSGELSILSPDGREVKRLKVNNPTVEIDLSTNPVGIYFIRYYPANGLIQTKKIIKTN